MILDSLKRTQIVKKKTSEGGNMEANKIRWVHLSLPPYHKVLLSRCSNETFNVSKTCDVHERTQEKGRATACLVTSVDNVPTKSTRPVNPVKTELQW